MTLCEPGSKRKKAHEAVDKKGVTNSGQENARSFHTLEAYMSAMQRPEVQHMNTQMLDF
jgi:hypothetical protein